MVLVQHSAWAHGGEDHGRTAQPKGSETPQATPIQPESPQNGSTQPSQATTSGAPSSAEVTTETGVAPTQQSSVLSQIPTVGFSESLFGLILIAPFGLTLLRRRAQNARKSLRKTLP